MKKYILLAAAAISLVSCNEDNYIDEPIAAQISATIGESSMSRASDITWDTNDIIGIFMGDRYSNVAFATENGDGIFTGSTMYFRNKQESLNVTAYYPYTGIEGAIPDVIEASTTAERQIPSEQSKFDFLYAVKENVTGANPDIQLTFSHMMSKLTFVFQNGNDGTDVSKITTCEINGLILDGSFNPATGVCEANTTNAVSPLTLTPTVVNEKELPSLILFPQTVEKVTLKITDNQEQEYSCDLPFNNNRLESGNNYKYTIIVKKTGLVIKKFSIAEWSEQGLKSEAVSD